MPRQEISKYLKQMKFMRRTRAEEIDKEQSEQTLFAPTNDEYWVLDIPGLDQFKPVEKFPPIISFNQCLEMKFGRFSANGQNPHLEALLEKRMEDRKMREFDEIINDSLLTEEELLESYLSHARHSVKSVGQKKNKVTKDSVNENRNEAVAIVIDDKSEEFNTTQIDHSARITSFRQKSSCKPKGFGVKKKKSNMFTGIGRKAMSMGGVNKIFKSAKGGSVTKKLGKT